MKEYTKKHLIINTNIGDKNHFIVRNDKNRMIHFDLEHKVYEIYDKQGVVQTPITEDNLRMLEYAINNVDRTKAMETCLQIIYDQAIQIF